MALYAALLWVSNDESCLKRIDSLFKAHQGTVPLPTLRYALTDILGYDPVIPCAIMETGLRLYHHPQAGSVSISTRERKSNSERSTTLIPSNNLFSWRKNVCTGRDFRDRFYNRKANQLDFTTSTSSFEPGPPAAFLQKWKASILAIVLPVHIPVKFAPTL